MRLTSLVTTAGLCLLGLCLACSPVTGKPMTATMSLEGLQSDALAPKFHQNALHFSTANGTTSAWLPGEFNLTEGIRIELEFMTDSPQDNPFPRLIEGKTLSLHLTTTNDGNPNYGLKLLAQTPDGKAYAQVIAHVVARPGVWRKVVATMEPGAHRLTLSVDGLPALTETLAIRDFHPGTQRLLLGASAPVRDNRRGFNGAIRNLAITTPFDPDDQGEELPQLPRPTIGGQPVQHMTIKHLRGRHLAFPGFDILPNGDWAIVFREGEAHVCPYGRICLILSKDQGRNWSAPISISDTASDERDPAICTLPDGRVLVTHGGWNSWLAYPHTRTAFAAETAYIEATGPQNYGGSVYMFSSDNGQTWTSHRRMPAFAPHGPAIARNRLYAVTMGETNGLRTIDMRIMNLSDQTWEGPYRIASHPLQAVDISFEEPYALALRDGSLLVAIREPRQGYLYVSRSEDDGKTWTPVQKTEIRGFPHHLLELADGRILCTYGYRYYPYGIRACFSHDGGRTWRLKDEVVIQNNGVNTDLGYPVSRQLPNGDIVTVYYHNTQERPDCHIEGARWTP